MRDYARLYQDLLKDLSSCDHLQAYGQGFYTSDQSLKDVYACQLAASFYKKLAPSGQSADVLSKSLALFNKINDSISTSWSPPEGNESRTLAVEYWKQNFAQCLDFEIDGVNFDLEYIRDHFNTGPGASIDANADSFYTKMFDSPLSTTHPYLIALFRAAIVESPTWSEAELLRFHQFGFTEAEGNRLFFVPKNSDISRTCCTEPALNMLFQQALGRFLEYRLKKRFRIDLSTQPDVNRRLARFGSNDGSFATLDLTSASDSIGWDLMKQSIPNNLLGYFRLFRSPKAILPDGSTVPLNMISTMGNGFTFPLQTIIFASAVKACYELKGIQLFDDDGEANFSVFGDDIIVRTCVYESVVTLLTDLGFIVSDGKSFNVGPFRESCGFDYFKGIPVRGVYIKTLETRSSVYSAFNRLSRWSAVSGIPLINTLSTLLSWEKFLPIPFSEADDAGFKVPEDKAPSSQDSNGWVKYRYLAPVATVRSIPRDFVEARTLGYKAFNPYGWGVCFFGGYAHNPEQVVKTAEGGVGKPLSLRACDLIGYRPPLGATLHRKSRKRSIPFWDFYDDLDPRFPARFLGRWKSTLARVM